MKELSFLVELSLHVYMTLIYYSKSCPALVNKSVNLLSKWGSFTCRLVFHFISEKSKRAEMVVQNYSYTFASALCKKP